MLKLFWACIYLVMISFLINDHNLAPDHYTYNNFLSCEESVLESSSNAYEKSWSYIINLSHKCVFENPDTSHFYFGIGLFLTSIFILSKTISPYNQFIFLPSALFSYTGVLSTTIDKSSIILFIFTLIYIESYFDYVKVRKFTIIFICLISLYFLRGWLLPFAFLIIFLSNKNYLFKVNLFYFETIVILLTIISLTIFINFKIFVKYFLIIPFIFFDPLPKDDDKFILGGLFYFLSLAIFFKFIFYLYFIYIKKIFSVDIYSILILVIFLSFSILLHAIYFEIQDSWFGYSSDAVRKASFFWPILLSMLLSNKSKTNSEYT